MCKTIADICNSLLCCAKYAESGPAIMSEKTHADISTGNEKTVWPGSTVVRSTDTGSTESSSFSNASYRSSSNYSSGCISKKSSGSHGYNANHALPNVPTFWERKRMKPMMTLRGGINQVACGGTYPGTQCTSIALTALGVMSLLPACAWDTEILDNVITFGDAQHTRFRDVLKLSTNPDNRIALDDLPSELKLDIDGYGVTSRIKPTSDNLFLKNTCQTRQLGCKSLYTYLKSQFKGRQDELSGVITVGEYSYSFMRDQSHFWWLFDSHGSLKIARTRRDISVISKESHQGTLKGATLTKFSNPKAIVQLLLKNHRPDIQVEVREVVSVPHLDLVFTSEDDTVEYVPIDSSSSSAESGSTEYLSTLRSQNESTARRSPGSSRFQDAESEEETVSFKSDDVIDLPE